MSSASLTLGLGGAGSLALPRAARGADYKALVCIFLFGGNDGNNMIVPTDATRYTQYSTVRQSLALSKSSLVAMDGTNHGLHPAMSALKSVYSAGRLAPVFNVGPLVQPLTKSQYRAASSNSDVLPDNLFSHSDQQTLWASATGDAFARTGWGGRASVTLGTTNPVISVGGNGRFGLSSGASPIVLPLPGETFGVTELGSESWRLASKSATARASALEALYGMDQGNTLGNAYVSMQSDAFALADRLGSLVATSPSDAGSNATLNSAFSNVISDGDFTTDLAAQLYQIAQLIASRATVGGTQQIYYASLGGFDTHGSQIGSSVTTGTHATLLETLADAMAAFDSAMVSLGLSSAVTTFTQSDFGRTFAPNQSKGTDHAWGNHHLIMGGAVQGGKGYGTAPSLVLGGDDDVGVDSWELQGRWIPTTSVDQYAATLLKWFGASDSQLTSILPNLSNFSTKTLGFV